MPKYTENRRAGHAVALHDPGDKIEMLDILGLIDPDDPTRPRRTLEPKKGERVAGFDELDNSPLPASGPRVVAYTEPWDRQSVPEGLRNYDAREPVTPPPPKVRNIPQIDPSKCGTLTGRAAHSKRNHALLLAGLPNEPSCDICRPFYTQYQRDQRAKRMARSSS